MTLKTQWFCLKVLLNPVDSVDFWISARILRNKIAHAYLPEELKDIIVKKVQRIEDRLNDLP